MYHQYKVASLLTRDSYVLQLDFGDSHYPDSAPLLHPPVSHARLQAPVSLHQSYWPIVSSRNRISTSLVGASDYPC